MSSWLLLPLSLAGAPAGAAAPVTAEDAMKAYRETFSAVPTRRCAVPDRPDELVVCARLPEADRLPLPAEPEPGERIRMVPGETQSMAGAVSTCVYACPPATGINLKQAADIIARLGRALED